MNQTLFWNAFNIKELAYQQCSLCVFALALYTFDEVGFAGGCCVLSWRCFELISECPSPPEQSGRWWVCKLGGWMGRSWRRTWDRRAKAHPTHLLLLDSPFSALLRLHHSSWEPGWIWISSKRITSALLTKIRSAVRQLNYSSYPFCVRKTRFCRCLCLLSPRWENSVRWSVIEKTHDAWKTHTEVTSFVQMSGRHK